MRAPSRRAAFALAVAAAVGDLMLLRPGAATADAPAAVGSWHLVRQQNPAGAVPSTPLTDDGTLPVQNGPAGPLAFSALRYAVPDATGGTLTLTVSGQPPAVPPAVDACAVTSGWEHGEDQTWDRRPSYDCTRAAKGSATGSRMTWQIGADLVRGGTLDVALVPAPGDPTPFAVSFAAPAGDSFAPSTGAGASPLAVPPVATGAAGGAASTRAPATTKLPSTTKLPPTTKVPPASAGAAPPASPPVVAPAAGGGGAQAPLPTARAAATRGPASRALGAGGLAALAGLLLLRTLVGAGPRGRPPRSLVTVHREVGR